MPNPFQLDFFSQDISAPSAPRSFDTNPTSKPRHLAQPDTPFAPPIHSNLSSHESASNQTVKVGTKRHVQVGTHNLDYALRRSKRRSIGFMIDDEGLRITAPRWTTVGEIENAIREKQRWILSKLHERRDRSVRRLEPQMRWTNGATIPYLGGQLTLRLEATQTSGITHNTDTGELIVCLPAEADEQQLKDRVQAWMQMEAKRLFGERLPVYAEKLGVTYLSFALSSATTQWGSCTADGKIRLNWRLIHFSLPLIDYVIAHELAHLREMNHGPRFWSTVQSIFPEFEMAKKTLREQSRETLPVF